MSEHKEGMPSPEDEAPIEDKDAQIGDKFRVGGRVYTLIGDIGEPKDENDPTLTGKLEGEELHEQFSQYQLERGIFAQETEELIQDIDAEMPKLMADYWEAECTGEAGKTNNPEGLTL